MGVMWRRTVGPAEEPITLADVKRQCRISPDVLDEDQLVFGYLEAARELGEGYTARGWLTQTWVMTCDDWAEVAGLPMAAPLQSVTTVKYYDEDGTLQTLSASVYDVDTASTPGAIALKSDQSWPSLQTARQVWRIEVTYVVGWTAPALVPSMFKQGVLLLVDSLYENRSAVQVGIGVAAVTLPFGVDTFWPDEVRWSPSVCA
jgi:uncharacterized phiE125 gp8 family phage protein